jgi:hypothetical protein
MDSRYCSHEMRCGKQQFDSEKEKLLMEVLMEFGKSIDPHGYDDGNYDEAMTSLLEIIADT